jgi:hypothetical protein
MGGRESDKAVRERHLRWRKQHLKACRWMRSEHVATFESRGGNFGDFSRSPFLLPSTSFHAASKKSYNE